MAEKEDRGQRTEDSKAAEDREKAKEKAFVTLERCGYLVERDSEDSGTVELFESPEFADGDQVDVVWGGGSRRAVDAVAVGDRKVSISGGLGVDLPSETTPVIIEIQRPTN